MPINAPEPSATDTLQAMMRLTMTPGLGPILIRRAIDTLGSPQAVLDASETGLRRVQGIGGERARTIAAGFAASEQLAQSELRLADSLGVRVLSITDPDYPPLLAETPDAPPILYVRGFLDLERDRYPLGIVGSRHCTHYGTEQAERFAAAIAQAGLTIVSGGARGVDTAAHRAALRVGGRTIVVLGCGLAHCYPPDNQSLFEQVVTAGGRAEHGAHGAVISELPLNTPPSAENFPARNRIISGLSLGVLVVEAGLRSGALITARVAAEDHGREVFALPARVDSSAAEGSLNLIKAGGAVMVTHPDDVLLALESAARHHFHGTHAARFPAAPSHATTDGVTSPEDLFARTPDKARATSTKTMAASSAEPKLALRDAGLTDGQRAILAALDDPRTFDELATLTSIGPASLRAEITVLEIKRRVRREGSRIARSHSP